MRAFLNEFRKLIEYLEDNDIYNFKKEIFYVIFDNFEKINVSEKFLATFLSIKKILSIKLGVCVIGVNFHEG